MKHGTIVLPDGLAPEGLKEAAARHGAHNVRVFGSVARGTATQESDLDLLVDFEPGRNLFDLVGFKQEIEEAMGGRRRVDVVTENALPPRVRERVLREALSV